MELWQMFLAIHHALRTSGMCHTTSAPDTSHALRSSERATQLSGRFQIAPRLSGYGLPAASLRRLRLLRLAHLTGRGIFRH